MSQPFRPYQDWLGLPEGLIQPDYFQLLGIEESESDPRKIASAADRAASKVRRCRPGEHAAEWAKLLDEIAAAKRLLTDPQSRADYAASRSSATPANGPHPAVSRPQSTASGGAIPIAKPITSSHAPSLPVPARGLDPMAPAEIAAALPAPIFGSPAIEAGSHPAGIPYLQPAPTPSPMDPMQPADLAMAPYLPPTLPTAGSGDPMAPAPAATPTFPAAAIPAGIPTSPAAAMPGAPAVTRSSAAILAARHGRRSSFGPIALGAVAGLVLLGVVGGIYVYQSGALGPREVAQSGANQTPAATPANSFDFRADAPRSNSTQEPAPSNSSDNTPPAPLPLDGNDATPWAKMEDGPATDMPAPENPAPSPDMPKPEPTPTPMPAPAPETLPQPTEKELAKLGLALTKARTNIGTHYFEKADAFLELASEMPRLPEHQAMIDRLKLLAQSVLEYRTAIETSIGKLESGSSFEVGELNVGIVETGADLLIVRVNGQNRRYSIVEMPLGLAAAVAAQTLPPDDSKTLMLKGAYTLAHPRATADELKKAKEFLETAGGSIEEANELLKLLEDQYELAKAP